MNSSRRVMFGWLILRRISTSAITLSSAVETFILPLTVVYSFLRFSNSFEHFLKATSVPLGWL